MDAITIWTAMGVICGVAVFINGALVLMFRTTINELRIKCKELWERCNESDRKHRDCEDEQVKMRGRIDSLQGELLEERRRCNELQQELLFYRRGEQHTNTPKEKRQ